MRAAALLTQHHQPHVREADDTQDRSSVLTLLNTHHIRDSWSIEIFIHQWLRYLTFSYL